MKKIIFWAIGILVLIGLVVGLTLWIGGTTDLGGLINGSGINTVSTILEAVPSSISTSAGRLV